MRLGAERHQRSGLLGGMLLLAGLIGAEASAAPGDTDILTLETAVREAVAWHPSVTQAIGQLNARGEEVAVAKAGYYPQIRAGLGSGYDNAIGGRTRWRPRVQASVQQMIFDFGKVSGAVESARAGTKVGRAQLLISVDNLIRDAAFSVIEMQRNEALHQVALDQRASVESISDLVRLRFDRGAATKSDALQAQARVEAANATIAEIEAEQRRWASNLMHLTGRTSLPEVDDGAPGWLAAACSAGEPNWSSVPGVMEAEALREQAVAELKRARAEGLPTISLAAGTGTDVSSPFSNGRTDYNVGINVSSSLYSGGAARARARGAAYSLGAADAAAVNAQNEASRLLSEAQQQISSLNQVLGVLRDREAQMQETGKLYRLQYLEMGTRTLVDLLNAEQEFHQVRFDMANTVHDLRRLEVDCSYQSGSARDSFGLGGKVVRGVTL